MWLSSPRSLRSYSQALFYLLTKGQVLVGVLLRRRLLFRGLCLTCHLVICLLCFFRASCNIFTLFYWLLCSRRHWGSSSFLRHCEDTVILSGRSVMDALVLFHLELFCEAECCSSLCSQLPDPVRQRQNGACSLPRGRVFQTVYNEDIDRWELHYLPCFRLFTWFSRTSLVILWPACTAASQKDTDRAVS